MNQKLLSFFLLCTLFIGAAYGQNRQVTGRVTSATDGSALAGVSVALVGSTTATQTDENGRYTISVSSNGTLTFTYVGYASQRIAVGNQSVVNVALVDDQETLEEVEIGRAHV